MFIITYFIIILFVFLILILIVIWSIFNGIGPMPSSPKAKRILLENLPPSCYGPIYELGSGWGTLVFPLAKKYPHCSIIAYENSPIPFFISKIRHLFSRDKNLKIERKNFFKVDLGNAAMIICYLYPGAMQKLKTKFEKELNKNTVVVSNTFSIPGWKAYKICEISDIYHSKIFMYVYE